MRKIKMLIVMASAGLAMLLGALQKDTRGEAQLQAAINKEVVEGDLKAAIEQYRKIVTAHRANRAVAAKALVRMGQCYEKLGDTEARKAYEQAIREYGDQKEAVAVARTRLAALEGKQGEKGVVARQIWAGDSRMYGMSISQDGRYVAFEDGGRIGLHDLVTGETRQVGEKFSPESGEYIHEVLISPDAKQIAYARERPEPDENYELYVIGVDGSRPRLLAGGKDSGVWPYCWSPDGKHILADLYSSGEKGQLVLVTVADGSVKVIGSPAPYAQLSPDGRYIACARRGKLPSSGLDIFVLHVAEGRETPLVENPGNDSNPTWTPDGKHVLFISDRLGKKDLWSIPVAEGKPAGRPGLVRENVGDARAMGISREGDYYYWSDSNIKDIYVAEADPQSGKLASRPRQLVGRYINTGPAFSPDGQYLAYYSQRGTAWYGRGALTMVIRSMKSGAERVLLPKSPLSLAFYSPQWFPDGRSLFIHLWDGKFRQIDVQSGEDRPVLESADIPSRHRSAFLDSTVLAPNGRAIYYVTRGTEAEPKRILRRELETNGEKELCRLNARWLEGPSVSPDGNRLAFVADGAVMTLPANGGEPGELYRARDPRLGALARQTVWSKDGRRVFFSTPSLRQPSDEIWSIPAEGGEATPLGIGLHQIWFLDSHPDGRQLAFVDVQDRVEIWALKNLLREKEAK